MSLLDPGERSQRGAEQQAKLTGKPAPEPTTLYESSWRDYIFAEVWTRDGLDLRSRYLITISSAATAETPQHVLDGYLRGAVVEGALSLAELREAALHFAIYGGWSRGAVLDESISRIAKELALPAHEYQPIRKEPWCPETRLKEGATSFKNVMTFGGPPAATAYFEGGILNYVFGEVWERPGLDQRSRRWVTLVGVADSSANSPIRSHIYGAMASGNTSYEEMTEFVLQYAIHSGWPRASFIQGVVFEMAANIKKGLDWQGEPVESQ